MRVAAAIILAVLVPLAGCADDAPADPGPTASPSVTPSPSSPTEGRTGRNGTEVQDAGSAYFQVFDLFLTGGSAAGPAAGHAPGNCLIMGPGARILEGNMTVTWTAQGPASERLQVVVEVGGSPGFDIQTGPLPSPIVVDLTGLPQAAADGNTAFSIQVATPGTAVQLPVQAQLQFTYTGTVDFQGQPAGCTYA